VFHCVPGRLPALLKPLRLFERHGIKPFGFWTVAIGESCGDFVLDSAMGVSLAEREKFGAFLNDPEWLEARRKSEEDGPVEVSLRKTILVPTALSLIR
jgi:NIPSNAP